MDNVPVISCNGSPLPSVTSAKLLGLDIDEELSFSQHVDNVCKKISQRIGVLKKITNYLPNKQRLLYYNATIRPILNYVNVIWSSCEKKYLDRVLKLQKRAARVILDAHPQAPTVLHFNRLKRLPFYDDAKITNWHRTHRTLPTYLDELLKLNSKQHNRKTRYSNFNLVCPRFVRQTEGGRMFTTTTCQLWNS